jgi:hypothetical protein
MQQSNIYLGIYTIEYYFLLEKSRCYKLTGRSTISFFKEKRKIVGVEDVIDEEEYIQFDTLPPFGEDITIPTIDDTEEPTYICHDHDEAIIVR